MKKDIVGKRVELVSTKDAYTDLQPGIQGEVAEVDDTGTVHVDWDNGSTLGLVPKVDKYKVIG